MKRTIFIPATTIMLFIFYACPHSPYNQEPYNAPYGYFPEKVVNIERFNSEYDDINMNYIPPEIYGTEALIYSSNMNSKGENFDIIGDYINYYWDKDSAKFEFRNTSYFEMPKLATLLKRARSDFDELGPTIFSNNLYTFLFYSNNENGSLDLKFVKYNRSSLLGRAYIDTSLLDGPFTIPYLSNPDFNESYLTFKVEITKKATGTIYPQATGDITLMFCSDSLGQYDIYTMKFPYTNLSWQYFRVFFNEKFDYTKTYQSELNTEFNERCPFIFSDLLIFSSDRPGGYGGYDFYYSYFRNGQWGEPVNMGEPINSKFDEYRAILIPGAGFMNQLLVFSSDREGGKGGFDLYCTGLDILNH